MDALVYQFNDYRDVLQYFFAERRKRNPAYSLRAFARDLDISPSSLSEVLNRKHHLSLAMAKQVGKRLSNDKNLGYYLVDLLEAQTATQEKNREEAAARLLKYRFQSAASQLHVDQFRLISDWYHLAILELFKLRNYQVEPTSIAKSLGIDVEIAKEALSRLVRLGFVAHHDNTYQLLRAQSYTEYDTHESAVCSFQRQILEKAIEALPNQNKQQRVGLTAIAATNKDVCESMRNNIRNLIENFVTQEAQQSQAEHVYCLTVNMFPMTQRSEHDSEC